MDMNIVFGNGGVIRIREPKMKRKKVKRKKGKVKTNDRL